MYRGEGVVSMKVYEVMEQYKDYKFLIYSSDGDCLFEGYNVGCNTLYLIMFVKYFYELRNNKIVVIFLC